MQNEAQHIACLRAQGHTNANFTGALRHGISNSPVNPDARQQKRDSGENPMAQVRGQRLLFERPKKIEHDTSEGCQKFEIFNLVNYFVEC